MAITVLNEVIKTDKCVRKLQYDNAAELTYATDANGRVYAHLATANAGTLDCEQGTIAMLANKTGIKCLGATGWVEV